MSDLLDSEAGVRSRWGLSRSDGVFVVMITIIEIPLLIAFQHPRSGSGRCPFVPDQIVIVETGLLGREAGVEWGSTRQNMEWFQGKEN